MTNIVSIDAVDIYFLTYLFGMIFRLYVVDIRLIFICFYLFIVKECMYVSVTNYNYVGDTKISVSIKKLMTANAH